MRITIPKRKMADVVGTLRKIARRSRGILKPESVEKAARNPSSPLHPYFTWDDSEAARLYRIEQARQLIRVVVDVSTEPRGEPTRVFVSLKADQRNGDGYRALATVMSDAEMRRMLVDDAIADMRNFRDRYVRIAKLAGVRRAMAKAENTLRAA